MRATERLQESSRSKDRKNGNPFKDVWKGIRSSKSALECGVALVYHQDPPKDNIFLVWSGERVNNSGGGGCFFYSKAGEIPSGAENIDTNVFRI